MLWVHAHTNTFQTHLTWEEAVLPSVLWPVQQLNQKWQNGRISKIQVFKNQKNTKSAATKVPENNGICPEVSLYSTLSALILGVRGHQGSQTGAEFLANLLMKLTTPVWTPAGGMSSHWGRSVRSCLGGRVPVEAQIASLLSYLWSFSPFRSPDACWA